MGGEGSPMSKVQGPKSKVETHRYVARVSGERKSAGLPCTLPVSSIPTGLCNSAQGCEERATLGKETDDSQPQRGCGMVLFPSSSATTLSGLSPMWRAFSQGSSFLATLGFVAESLWDSALGVDRVPIMLDSPWPV